jgi:hypothetical protein
MANNSQVPIISEITERILKQIEQLIKLDNVKLKEKNDDIKQMISYYNDLTQKIEDRRIRVHNFSLQMLAVSVAAVGLLVASEKKMGFYGKQVLYCAIAICVIFIISSIITNIFFLKQSLFKYPWKKLDEIGQNKWKWFYYGNQGILEINSNPFKEEKVTETTVPYLKNLETFISSYKEEDLSKEISNNIQQLYLLQVHNYYKNRFYLQLTKIMEWTFWLVLGAIVCFMFIIIIHFLSLL